MPQRPPTFAERLRAALGHERSPRGRNGSGLRSVEQLVTRAPAKGSDFAERLRRAVGSH